MGHIFKDRQTEENIFRGLGTYGEELQSRPCKEAAEGPGPVALGGRTSLVCCRTVQIAEGLSHRVVRLGFVFLSSKGKTEAQGRKSERGKFLFR